MNVCIRVDSSYHIGTGHIMRCLVLAELLRSHGHMITFICRDLPGNIIALLKKKFFSVVILPCNIFSEHISLLSHDSQEWLGASWQMDCQETLSYLKQKKNNWLIVDHYKLDFQWETIVRPYIDNILVIDDLADRAHECDIIVDANYYSSPDSRYQEKIPKVCKTLIGPQFALLRPEFSKIKRKRQHYKKIKRLMVFLGGIDYVNGTRKILEGIYHSDYRDLEVDVVMGSNSLHKSEIEQWCLFRKNYLFHSPAQNMAELMMNADIAIGAGGTTTWERCCLGLPSLVACIANNQEELIKEGADANLFYYLGEINYLNKIIISEQINDISKNIERLKIIGQNGFNLVDGLGAQRVVKEMELFKR